MTKTEYDSKQADWIRREQELLNEIERLKSENNMYREAENDWIEERKKIDKLECDLKTTKEKFFNLKNKVMLFLEA